MRTAAIIVVICFCRAAGGADELAILWTGETHAMLRPCACPLRPEGGIARRAAAVAAARARGPALLVDAGGWAAGGIYDEYTEGERVDAIRTEAAAAAMQLMRYDAVAISDEELADGGALVERLLALGTLPLTSANLVRAETGLPVAPPFRVAERGGWRVAVVGLTTPLGPDAGGPFRTTPPVETARAAVAAARAGGAELVVVLSPLGEEQSETLAREVAGIDLVVNAHRRTTAEPSFRVGRTLVAQFSFQGRSLARATAARAHTALGVEIAIEDALVLGPDVPDDGPTAALVASALAHIAEDASARVLVLELFKMPQCPYTPDAEKTVAELARSLGSRARVRITQLVHTDASGKLASLHGPGELEEARRQAAVFEFYPDTYFAYAAWRHENPADEDWLGACRRLGMSAARLRASVVSGEAEEILKRHAGRVERLRVASSPTLYFGGRRHEGGTGRLELLRAACAALPGGTAGVRACVGLPACFSAADCRRPGVVVECAEPGTEKARCVEHPAIALTLTVVADARAVHAPSARVVESLRVFFPGLTERAVAYASPEGAALVARYAVDTLPAYVLPAEALEGRGIEAVREALVPTAGALVVAPRMVGSHQLISRTRHEGRVDLFLAPHATAAADALAELLDLRERGEAPTVRLHAMAWRNTDGRLAAQGGLAELEAMMREAAAGEAWPERFEAYLRARQKRVGSSYWSDAAVESGIDPLELRAHAEGDAAVALIDADAQMLAELATGGPVVVLVANQELVPCASRTEVRHALTAARALAERVGVAEAELPSRRAEAVPLLVRALEAAPDAASERIVRGLRALTGESFGGDADRWRSWLDARAR